MQVTGETTSTIGSDVLAAVLESQPWGTLLLNGARRCVYASASARRLLSDEALVGRTIDAILPTLAEAVRQQMDADASDPASVAATHRPGRRQDSHDGQRAREDDAAGDADAVVADSIEARHRVLARGVEIPAGAQWLWVREAPLQAGSGQVLAGQDAALTTMSLVDATDMRRAFDERMASLRFMSHDLRSPQNSILALTQLYEQDRQAFEDCGGLQRIGELARFALSLGDDFVFDCVASGWQHRDAARFDLCATVRALVPQWNVAAVYRGVHLRVWLAEGQTVWLHGVKTFVARALQNLVDNAIQASPRHAVVSLSIALADGAVVVTVRDEAGGLPGLAAYEGEQPMTDFAPLAAHTRNGQGLGLRLSERVVRMHGGTLCARPIREAGPTSADTLLAATQGRCRGTAFEVRLPALMQQRVATGQRVDADDAGGQSGRGMQGGRHISALVARDAQRGG